MNRASKARRRCGLTGCGANEVVWSELCHLHAISMLECYMFLRWSINAYGKRWCFTLFLLILDSANMLTLDTHECVCYGEGFDRQSRGQFSSCSALVNPLTDSSIRFSAPYVLKDLGSRYCDPCRVGILVLSCETIFFVRCPFPVHTAPPAVDRVHHLGQPMVIGSTIDH